MTEPAAKSGEGADCKQGHNIWLYSMFFSLVGFGSAARTRLLRLNDTGGKIATSVNDTPSLHPCICW